MKRKEQPNEGVRTLLFFGLFFLLLVVEIVIIHGLQFDWIRRGG